MNQETKKHPASFRDPSGYVFEKDGIIYRFVSQNYREHYNHLFDSGLYNELTNAGLLLPFEEIAQPDLTDNCYKIIKPQRIPFLNYAKEWCFEQLKDAALTTLRICRRSLLKGMILKDATHLNIQFVHGKAQLIDSLSFEKYDSGNGWIAYRQFCENFLNPLMLNSYCGTEVHRILLAWPEGITAAETAALLPFKSNFSLAVFLHVHLQKKVRRKKNTDEKEKDNKSLSSGQIIRIIDHLESYISKLKPRSVKSAWQDYYSNTILSQEYLNDKKEIINTWLNEIPYHSVCDFGSNSGEFSKLCKHDALVISTDADSHCINDLYLSVKKEKRSNIVPLIVDLNHPAPSSGWENMEQKSFIERSDFDLGLALALVHHLAVGKNIPLGNIANFFASRVSYLIIEFVPKTDPKVIEMLNSKEDIYHNYNLESFEESFLPFFSVKTKKTVGNSERTLFLMKRK
jgi:hypothetical protein